MKKVVRRGLPYIYMGYLLIIVTIIAVFGALTTIGASAEVTFDRSPYTYNGKSGVTITGFNGLNGGETVTIPAEIDGKPVLAIGLTGVVTTTRVSGAEYIGRLDLTQATNLKVILPHAFYSCKNLVILQPRWSLHVNTETTRSSRVEEIGDCAFCGCIGLTSVDFPALKTVGKCAFDGCTGLTSVDFPALKTVGDWAFGDCTELTSLYLPALETVGECAFDGCTGLENISLSCHFKHPGTAFFGVPNTCIVNEWWPLETYLEEYGVIY